MLDKVGRYIRKKRQWRRYSRLASGIHSVTEFHRFISETGCTASYITDGPRYTAEKRSQAAATLDEYRPDVCGKRVLDIGPGYGDFLDVARERGAMTIGVDYDPLVVQWLRVRGHIAVQDNILWSSRVLDGNFFELIHLRGSVVVEYFSLVGMGRLRSLLHRIERLQAPGGTTLMIPFFEVKTGEWVRKIRDPLDCAFSDEMRRAGYEIRELQRPGQPDPMYPLVYFKHSGTTAGSDPAPQLLASVTC